MTCGAPVSGDDVEPELGAGVVQTAGGPVPPGSHLPQEGPSSSRSTGRRWLLGVSGVAVAAIVAGVAAVWFLGRDASSDGRFSASSPSDARSVDDRDADRDATTIGTAADEIEPTEASESSTSTTDEATTTSSSGTSTSGLYTERTELYGRYVAVLWSTVTAVPASNDDLEVIRGQLQDNQARFGDDVHAVESDDFVSLRNGTAAVVYDGGFTSALEAKRWCRRSGFPGLYDCFGVVLSDEFGPDDRGEYIRVYDV